MAYSLTSRRLSVVAVHIKDIHKFFQVFCIHSITRDHRQAFIQLDSRSRSLSRSKHVLHEVEQQVNCFSSFVWETQLSCLSVSSNENSSSSFE